MLATLGFHVARVYLPELWPFPSQFQAQIGGCHGSDGGWFHHPGVTSWLRLSCGGASRQPACSSHFRSRDARLAQCAEPPDGPGLRLLYPRLISSGLRLTAAAHQPQESPLTRLIGECFWLFYGRVAAGEMPKRRMLRDPRVFFLSASVVKLWDSEGRSHIQRWILLTGCQVQTVVRVYVPRVIPEENCLQHKTFQGHVDATASPWKRR